MCRRILTGCFLTALLGAPATAQVATLKKVLDAQAPAQAAADKPEDTRARLEQWLQDARETLARLDAPSAPALPEGVSPTELDDRRRDLLQLILTTTRRLKDINSSADARKALEASRAEDTAWTGFKEKPPYSLLLLDELSNEKDAIQAKLTSYESSLANYNNLLANSMGATKAAEETVSNMVIAVQNADDNSREAAKWRLDAARVKSRLLAAQAGLMQSSCGSLQDRIAAAKIDLALLERKAKTAKTMARFNDDDLTKIKKISALRKQTLRKEIDGIAKRFKTAMTARNQAQGALDTLLAATPEGKESDALTLTKLRLEAADGRVEGLQAMTDGLDSLMQLELVFCEAYEYRQDLVNAPTIEARNKVLVMLGNMLERMQAWENVLTNDIANSIADLSKLESRTGSITAEDPRFNLINEQRATKNEMFSMYQRLSQAVVAQRKLLARWVQEYSPKPDAQGLANRLSTLATTGWGIVQKIWGFEVMSFEDKMEVQGQTLTVKIPIRLSTLLRALMFFIIGYWITARIANRIEASLVTRGHIAEAQARTLRNWAMIVVGVFLAIGTLSFLKIPLTVFAFFGGALAIGLGFGMQTLIKNFISGIIVLAERKVRVGDMLDVDGIVGTVTEINTRSSIIKSPDDVETMIPNSLFLENRVTNWTLSNARVRRGLRVGVSYGTPPQTVMDILAEAASRHGLVCKTPAPFAVFEDFGESALIFHLYFWLELKGATNAMIVTSDLRLIIEKRLLETGIGIPCPQRDVRLATDQPLQIEWAAKPTPATDN